MIFRDRTLKPSSNFAQLKLGAHEKSSTFCLTWFREGRAVPGITFLNNRFKVYARRVQRRSLNQNRIVWKLSFHVYTSKANFWNWCSHKSNFDAQTVYNPACVNKYQRNIKFKWHWNDIEISAFVCLIKKWKNGANLHCVVYLIQKYKDVRNVLS